MMIELTDYETGAPVSVNPRAIDAVVPLKAMAYAGSGGTIVEEGDRTRIDYGRGFVLVRETHAKVMELIAAVNR